MKDKKLMSREYPGDVLQKKYPKIFPHGIWVSEGWFGIVDQVCDCIQQYIDCGNGPQVEIHSIKEKYGEIRFDDHGGDEYTAGMLWFTTYLSRRTCEVCGESGEANEPPGWIKVRCDKHSDQPKKLVNKIRKYLLSKWIDLIHPIRMVIYKIERWLYVKGYIEDDDV